MAWMIDRAQLDAEQNNIIDLISKLESKSYWIRGVAGTGKTVLICYLLHDFISKNNLKCCCISYTLTLKDMIETGVDSIGGACKVFTKQGLKKNTEDFNVIFCDEVQDMTKPDLEYLKSRCEYLIVSGDINQSIYEDDTDNIPTISSSEELIDIISPIVHQLNVVYRSPQTILDMVSRVFPDMFRDIPSYSPNIKPEIIEYHNNTDFYEKITSRVEKHIFADQSVAIIGNTHEDLKVIGKMFASYHDIKIDWDKKDSWRKPDWEYFNDCFEKQLDFNDLKIAYNVNNVVGVKQKAAEGKAMVLTYHGSKGLDFDNVFLTGCHKKFSNRQNRTNQLYLVGLTRATDNLYFFSEGKMNSEILNFFSSDSYKEENEIQDYNLPF